MWNVGTPGEYEKIRRRRRRRRAPVTTSAHRFCASSARRFLSFFFRDATSTRAPPMPRARSLFRLALTFGRDVRVVFFVLVARVLGLADVVLVFVLLPGALLADVDPAMRALTYQRYLRAALAYLRSLRGEGRRQVDRSIVCTFTETSTTTRRRRDGKICRGVRKRPPRAPCPPRPSPRARARWTRSLRSPRGRRQVARARAR